MGEFPTQPNSTKIDTRAGLGDTINRAKFGDDQLREYKIAEGQILPRSMGMAYHLYHSTTVLLW